MQLNRIDLLKIDLPPGTEGWADHGLVCWQKKEKDFNIHIFSAVFDNAKDLMEHYEKIRDDIAIYFQSQALTLDIERWNLYLFYFLGECLREDFKQKIQQDKFSMRKIVVDQSGKVFTEEYIKDKISAELFTFEIGERIINKQSVKDYLEKDHKQVIDFLKKNPHLLANELLLESLIKHLGNG